MLVHMSNASDHLTSSGRTRRRQQQEEQQHVAPDTHLPDEKMPLLEAMDTSKPPAEGSAPITSRPPAEESASVFVLCCSCCFGLVLVLASLFVGILIIYLHYLYGFMTFPYDAYDGDLCNFMQTWNQRMLHLIGVSCALGVIDAVLWLVAVGIVMDPGVCNSIQHQQQQVIHQQQQYQQKLSSLQRRRRQQQAIQDTAAQQEHEQGLMSCWTTTRSLIKFLIDAVFFVWMIQACWKTSFGVTGIQECPDMYTFTHIYSTILSVLAVLGIISSLIIWCLMITFGEPTASPTPPVEKHITINENVIVI